MALTEHACVGYLSDRASPIGALAFLVGEQGLSKAWFVTDGQTPNRVSDTESLIIEIKKQLRAYFTGQLTVFTIPLMPVGTCFQEKCWGALMAINYGTTISYAQQALEIGQPKATRAVANANGANPIPLFIPCHRVIASDGSLGGYGPGVHIKKWLLQHERDNLD